jgi:flagellar motor switch protein FliM
VTEAQEESARLSAEEMESLASSEERAGSAPFNRGRSAPEEDSGYQRALEVAAERHARTLSTLYQAIIRISCLSDESVEGAAFVSGCEPEELVPVMSFDGIREKGFLRFERPLFYAWLNRAFGARPSVPSAIPERALSRIEERFLLRIARDWAEQFAASAADWKPLSITVETAASPLKLESALSTGPYRHATFLVEGFGEPGHIHCLFPAALVGAALAPVEAGAAVAHRGVPGLVGQTPVSLRAQVATGKIALSEIARLRTGDVLPVDGQGDGGLLIYVEGRPKFRGVPGAVGARRAVRISERVDAD